VYRRYPANWGMTAVATPSPFIRAMFVIGLEVHPEAGARFCVAENAEASREMIQARRSSAHLPAAVGYQSR
jgi:hypothetical protein